jgi:Uma2 family endonuclease
MSTSSPTNPSYDYDAFPPVTLVELANRFGDIPATRICMNPPPGHATEEDMLYFQEHEGRLFELVDGTLIEKTMGNFESLIASTIHGLLFIYLRANPIGKSLIADTQLKLRRGAIRLPDVSFLSNERIQQSGFARRQKVAAVAPNLAVEVISEGNSKKEMADKLQEYFRAGTEEVWYVYPETRELHQFKSPAAPTIHQGDALITTPLLPGFEMKLTETFQLPGE